MALKETLDVITAFGYVAGTLTLAGLVYKGWKIFGPGSVRKPFSPALRAQMERNRKSADALNAQTAALIKQEAAPT